MKTKYEYTKHESDFINRYYPLNGSKFILEKLNVSENKLKSFIRKNKLKIKRDTINIDLNDKYLCYFLGLLWADGTVSISDRNRISLKMLEEDILELECVLYKVANWKKQLIVSGNESWSNTILLRFSDKEFKKFLIENDYSDKSYKSPNKILSNIPEGNRKYFFRGIVDGDGCFFIKKYNGSYVRSFTISSSYEQDWNYMVKLCEKCNFKYSIRRVVNNKSKGHKSSVFKLSTKNIPGFGEYIYDDFFGLERKYFKFKKIINSYTYNI